VGGANAGNVILADIDGDGLDDYILVGANGALNVWINNGDPAHPWRNVGEIAVGVDGASPQNVILADVDGDGRVDYLRVDADGAVQAWINTCNSPVSRRRRRELPGGRLAPRGVFCPINNPAHLKWTRAGLIIPHYDGASREAVLFADTTGDGRADYLLVSDAGAVRAVSLQGDIMNPTRVNHGKGHPILQNNVCRPWELTPRLRNYRGWSWQRKQGQRPVRRYRR